MSDDKIKQLEETVARQEALIAKLTSRMDTYEQCLEVIAGTMDQRVLAIIGTLSTAVAQHTIARSVPASQRGAPGFEYRLTDGETEPANDQTLKLVRGPVTTEIFQQSPDGWIPPMEMRVPLQLLANKFAVDNDLEFGKDYLVNLYRITPKVPEQNAPSSETPQ